MKIFSLLLVIGIVIVSVGIYEQRTFAIHGKMTVHGLVTTEDYNRLSLFQMITVAGMVLTLTMIPFVFLDIRTFRFKDTTEILCEVLLASLITVAALMVSYMWFVIPSFSWIYVIGNIFGKRWRWWS